MKLKSGFIPMEIDETSYLVPAAGTSFHGVIRGNRTAGRILKCLQEETTEEQIIADLCGEFDVSRDAVTSDVEAILAQLRGIDALQE